jgi:hypothetical protein
MKGIFRSARISATGSTLWPERYRVDPLAREVQVQDGHLGLHRAGELHGQVQLAGDARHLAVQLLEHLLQQHGDDGLVLDDEHLQRGGLSHGRGPPDDCATLVLATFPLRRSSFAMTCVNQPERPGVQNGCAREAIVSPDG